MRGPGGRCCNIWRPHAGPLPSAPGRSGLCHPQACAASMTSHGSALPTWMQVSVMCTFRTWPLSRELQGDFVIPHTSGPQFPASLNPDSPQRSTWWDQRPRAEQPATAAARARLAFTSLHSSWPDARPPCLVQPATVPFLHYKIYFL